MRLSLLSIVIILSYQSINGWSITEEEEKKKKGRNKTVGENDWSKRVLAAMDLDSEDDESLSTVVPRDDRKLTNQIKKVIGQCFITHRPLGIQNGIYLALRNVLRGYRSAINVLVEFPVVGWEIDGFVGLLRDSVVGFLSGGVMLSSGVATGAYQLAFGVRSTLSWWYNYSAGKVWNGYSWVETFNLDAEVDHLNSIICEPEIIGKNRRPQLRKGQGNRRVKDMSYYNVLRVPVDASSNEIKQAYRREAKQKHPDKSSEDETVANSVFQELSSAYLTLSNDELREAYDNHGMCFRSEVEEDQAYIDWSTFFATMFGSYSVESYVGEMAVVDLVDKYYYYPKETPKIVKDEPTYRTCTQRRREVEIAKNLRERVSDYVLGGQEAEHFRWGCRIEAEAIAKDGFGYFFLEIIGSTLVSGSSQFLGGQQSMLGWKGNTLKAKNNVNHVFKKISKFTSLSKAVVHSIPPVVKAVVLSRQKVKNKDKSNNNDCDKEGLEISQILVKELKPKLESWFVAARENIKQDIFSTLNAACEKLFEDNIFSSEAKIKLAEGVRILGEEFYAVGLDSAPAKNDNLKMSSDLSKVATEALAASKIKG